MTPREKLEDHPKKINEADIKFEGVSFTYPGSEHEALKDINVTIKQGEKVAIVGENGSGKSTFINLLVGMYEPDLGRISVSGKNVKDNLLSVRRAVSVVFQNFGQYESTIRENIIISDISKKYEEEQLAKLAKSTGAYELIQKQPGGFDEVIGNFSDSGNNLSGGQWQKVALTRALYRNKARILVLDEPTAALDPISEAKLYRDFAALTGDKTTLFISHRLGITSIVDRILVFSEGRIVEDGTHKDLMKADGCYSKMYRTQAQWYEK